MLIPINVVRMFPHPDRYTVWDTDTLSFREVASIPEGRQLPIMGGADCELLSPYSITVIGYCRSEYICSFGLNDIYMLSRKQLLGYKNFTNVDIKNNRVYVKDKQLSDMSCFFSDSNLHFTSNLECGSMGQARKFYATYKDKTELFGICKQSRVNDVRELDYEVLYMRVASVFNIPCCFAERVLYAGKDWVFSAYARDIKAQIFQSFFQMGIPADEVYSYLHPDDTKTFDKMMILDYCMEQADRHTGNIALVDGRLYPMFDNGTCLGLKPISMYSEGFRRYVESLPRSYIIGTLGFNTSPRLLSKISDAFDSDFRDEYQRFMRNYRHLLEG